VRGCARGAHLTTNLEPPDQASSIFGRSAQYYDLLYADKDYAGETAFIVEAVKAHSEIPVSRVLDLACGTGGHLLQMAALGWRVTGADGSEAMLDRARHKATELGLSPRLELADLRSFDLGETFDLVTCMFSSIGYVTDDEGLQSALEAVRRHLLPGGLYILEFWHGPAVVAQRPETRVRRLEHDGLSLIRIAEPSLDISSHTTAIRFETIALLGSALVDHIVENHSVRFFFQDELAVRLRSVGFDSLTFCALPDIARLPTKDDWRAVVIARAGSRTD
jgi:SAM-dependent methyltransferase